MSISQTWDREVDLLIFGAGAAGMTTALTACIEGLGVLVCEKSDRVGGTTATSGGTVWVPGNLHSLKTSHPDSADKGRQYFEVEMGPDTTGLREAFLASGAEAIDYLERHTDVRFKANDPYPDYHAEKTGGAAGGRALSPLPFDGRLLGADFEKLRAPIPELMVFGGMMVARDEIKYLIRPWRSTFAFMLACRRMLGFVRDRLRYSRGTRLVLGNALVGRLFHSCKKRSIEFSFETKLLELLKDGGDVVGALVEQDGERRSIRARRGVVLATGGCGASQKWREALTGVPVPYTQVLEGSSGDGLDAGIAAGGVVDKGGINSFWWFPSSRVPYPDGSFGMYPHIRDRPKPGLIAVNKAGHRFVNEDASYHDFVNAMFRSNAQVPTLPAWLICDRSFVRNYGLGVIHPVWQRLSSFEKQGYVLSAPTLAELALKAGIDVNGLAEAVELHNRAAALGQDDAFGKGTTLLGRHNGDPQHGGKNPCLKEIRKGPFFAMAVYPAPLGSSAGLKTNAHSQVLDRSGEPVQGLYACGNDMHSVMQGHYPGPGSTLGPAIVFAYRAAMHAVKMGGDSCSRLKEHQDIDATT